MPQTQNYSHILINKTSFWLWFWKYKIYYSKV